MDPVLILSPHLDDAVLSCGQFMAGRPDVHVLTLFAGVPPQGWPLGGFDAKYGFASSFEAVAHRRREDALALKHLGAHGFHGDLLDQQYLDGRESRDFTDALLAVADVVQAIGPEFVLAPVGVVHPDHEFACDVALHLPSTGVPVVLYEELPGRVIWPDVVAERLRLIAARGVHLESAFIGTGSHDVKDAAVSEYVSQLDELDLLGGGTGLLCCHVPERFWRVWL